MNLIPFFQNGISQLAILVPDLEKTVRNFSDHYGVGPWHFYTYRKPLVKKMTYNGIEADYSMRIALSNIGNIRIELIEPLEGDSIYQDFINEHGYGLHHIGLVVDDIGKALEIARNTGLKVIMDGSGFGLDGDGHYAYLDTESELGFVLELIQRPKKRLPPESIYPIE